MSASRNARGSLGWVILVVALAVPGVLFYNWWSHLKSERERSVAAKARGPIPDTGVFPSSPNAKLVNPMAPVVSTAVAPAQVSTISPAVAQAVEAATIALPPASTGQATAFPTPTAMPALKRDPTLSPFDRVRITEEEEAKRRAAEDLENMNRPRRPGRRSAVNPKSLVELQGIISTPEGGYKAIANNEVVAVGEYVGNTKVKIVKISDLSVTFIYQGKKFSKGVSRD